MSKSNELNPPALALSSLSFSSAWSSWREDNVGYMPPSALSSTISSFLNLPRELRDMIYEYALEPLDLDNAASYEYAISRGSGNIIIRAPTILLLNKQITEEFADIYKKRPAIINLRPFLAEWCELPTGARGKVDLWVTRRTMDGIKNLKFSNLGRDGQFTLFKPPSRIMMRKEGVLVGYRITDMSYSKMLSKWIDAELARFFSRLDRKSMFVGIVLFRHSLCEATVCLQIWDKDSWGSPISLSRSLMSRIEDTRREH